MSFSDSFIKSKYGITLGDCHSLACKSNDPIENKLRSCLKFFNISKLSSYIFNTINMCNQVPFSVDLETVCYEQ